jgi:ankyrin repeat protein
MLVAIINGHEDLVDLLLDKGADPNAEGGTTDLTVQGVRARPIPIELKTPPFRKQLLEVATEGGNGRNNTWGKPLQAAVHVANWHISDQFISVHFDRLRVIRSLLAHGADVNGRNTDMEPRWSGARYRRRLVRATAFLFAAKAADVEVMRLLLAHGADPNIATGAGTTPLMVAAGVNWSVAETYDFGNEALFEAVKLAHSLGNDVNAVNSRGVAAIHGAANRGANDVIEYLAANGARLDVADAQGRTPLDWAEGVFLATHPPVRKPETIALLERLLKEQRGSTQ